jgi:hypothetical protein
MTRTPNRPCPGCGKPLSADRISKRKKRCYACECRILREQREAAHDRRVEKLYGLRPGEYRKLYEAQGGKCAIYGCRARGLVVSLAVDHDHKLGLYNRMAVRGLLCKHHNRQIGYASDDPQVFDSLAAYLRNPPAREVLK